MAVSVEVSKIANVLTLLAVATALSACADSPSWCKDIVLESLKRDGVALPDDSGHPEQSVKASPLSDTGPITLVDLFRIAETNNPSFASARSEIGIAAGHAWQASLYPNPRLDVATEDISWGNGVSESKTTVGVTQPIILGDRRKAATDAANADRSARTAEVESQRRALFGEIAVLHSRLVSIRDQERLYLELRDLIGTTLSTAQARFEAKAVPETDVIRPRVELYRVDSALGKLKQEGIATAKELSLLLGGVPFDSSRLEGAITLTPQGLDSGTLESLVRRTHPSLAAADRKVEAVEARTRQLKAEKTPDLDVRLGVGYSGESEDGIVDLGVGISIPLWDAREGDTLAARFAVIQARQERAAIENELLRRLASALGEFEAAKAQLDTFRDKIVPDAQRAFDQTSEGYRGGRSSFLDLLDAQRTLMEARVTLTELASEVVIARAKVIQIVGTDGSDVPPGTSSGSSEEALSHTQVRPQGAEVLP